MKFIKLRETANKVARQAAKASPKFGSQGWLICEMALMIWSLKSLQTVVWAKNESLKDVSKFILKQPSNGGCHISFSGKGRGFQAAKMIQCSFLNQASQHINISNCFAVGYLAAKKPKEITKNCCKDLEQISFLRGIPKWSVGLKMP